MSSSIDLRLQETHFPFVGDDKIFVNIQESFIVIYRLYLCDKETFAEDFSHKPCVAYNFIRSLLFCDYFILHIILLKMCLTNALYHGLLHCSLFANEEMV